MYSQTENEIIGIYLSAKTFWFLKEKIFASIYLYTSMYFILLSVSKNIKNFFNMSIMLCIYLLL